jgi:hypothetical protein
VSYPLHDAAQWLGWVASARTTTKSCAKDSALQCVMGEEGDERCLAVRGILDIGCYLLLMIVATGDKNYVLHPHGARMQLIDTIIHIKIIY